VSDLASLKNPVHVLIVGCGYLGHRAAERWRRMGVRVSVITRSATKASELVRAGFDSIVGDLAAGELPSLPEIDTVLWSVGFDRSTEQSRESVWIDGLRYLVQQVPSTVRRFLYVSSTGVYGQTSGEVVDEFTEPQPTTASGQCCLQAEKMLQSFYAGESSCSLTILRLAGLYGPGRLLRRVSDLQGGKRLPGNANSSLNLIHVDDAVTAVADVACRRDAALLNVVNTGTLTRGEYYGELARLIGVPAPVFDESAPIMRGGNKRVVSVVRESLSLVYRFDDVRTGLQDAVNRKR